MRESTAQEKTNQAHQDREVYRFSLKDVSIGIFLTKHGHYRILEQNKISFQDFGRIITSIGHRPHA